MKTASTLFGAFLLLAFSSCKDKESTSDWEQLKAPEKPSEEVANTEPSNKPGEKTTKADSPQDGTPVRFLAYNLKNYLTMKRYSNGKSGYTSKPEDEIEALVSTIVDSKPDIIGICEIGSPKDLQDLQTRLKDKGLDLPHAHHLLGYDSVRTLAIISKFPIISTGKPEKDDYVVGKVPFTISRGILDATIQFPNKKVRCLGVHLKSKRPIPQADQELMRRAESGLLRAHINDILAKEPDTHLLVYGDFNDTKRTPTMRTAMGRLNAKVGLIVLNAKDSRGDLWTHHWSREDIYSRFDFVMVSKSLDPYVDKEGMKVLDPENWEKASDHRAILVPIR
ncbi:MAG: endonuclease/exonuclease/phosphatase family protein [Akkermansiaceae bacterium]